MKAEILKKYFLIILGLSVVMLSSTQENRQKLNPNETSSETNNSYYYRNYHCFDSVKQCELEMLKLIKFDTLIYVKSSQFHGDYKEIHGELTKINDSIYFVHPFKHLIQYGNDAKPFRVVQDSIFFYCDSSLINSNLEIEYLNGKKENYKIYSTVNRFWINEAYFNAEKKRIYLSFNYKNPIVDEPVEIVSKHDQTKYSICFYADRKADDFYVIVTNDYIKTLNIGTRGHQCSGPKFELDKMPLNTRLPRNRKLYD